MGCSVFSTFFFPCPDIVYGETASHTCYTNSQGLYSLFDAERSSATTWSNVKEKKSFSKDPFNLIPHRIFLAFSYSTGFSFSDWLLFSHRRSFINVPADLKGEKKKVMWLRSNHLGLALSGSPLSFYHKRDRETRCGHPTVIKY